MYWAEYFQLENIAGSIRIEKNQIEDNHFVDAYLYEHCNFLEEMNSKHLVTTKYAKVMLAELEPKNEILSYGRVRVIRFEIADFSKKLEKLEEKLNDVLNPAGQCIEIKPMFFYRIQYYLLYGNKKPETIFIETHPLSEGRIVSQDQFNLMLSQYNGDEDCALIYIENPRALIDQITGVEFSKCFIF